MPVKLGGSSGGGNLTFTETTGTALETLVAGDQVDHNALPSQPLEHL